MSEPIPPIEFPKPYNPSEKENERAAKIVKALKGFALDNFGENDKVVLNAETLEELKQSTNIPEDTAWEEFKREADEFFRTNSFFRISSSQEGSIVLMRKFNKEPSSRNK